LVVDPFAIKKQIIHSVEKQTFEKEMEDEEMIGNEERTKEKTKILNINMKIKKKRTSGFLKYSKDLSFFNINHRFVQFLRFAPFFNKYPDFTTGEGEKDISSFSFKKLTQNEVADTPCTRVHFTFVNFNLPHHYSIIYVVKLLILHS
jgi:hypothetical protein